LTYRVKLLHGTTDRLPCSSCIGTLTLDTTAKIILPCRRFLILALFNVPDTLNFIVRAHDVFDAVPRLAPGLGVEVAAKALVRGVGVWALNLAVADPVSERGGLS
jgi:hypothetical protein